MLEKKGAVWPQFSVRCQGVLMIRPLDHGESHVLSHGFECLCAVVFHHHEWGVGTGSPEGLDEEVWVTFRLRCHSYGQMSVG